MEKHLRVKHGTSDTSQLQYFCRLCGKNKAFRDQRRLEEHLRDHQGHARPRRDGREERADWNRNSIRNINKHLISGSSVSTVSPDDQRQRRRDDSGVKPARREVEAQGKRPREEQEDRRSREEDRDREYNRRSREENPVRREGGFGRGGRSGGFSRGGRGGGFSRGGRGRGGRGGGFEDKGRYQERG